MVDLSKITEVPAYQQHLAHWLNREYDTEQERDVAAGKILATITEYPDLISAGYSWRRMVEIGT